MAGEQSRRVIVRCPCGAKLAVSSTASGRKVKCPKCGQVLALRSEATASRPSPATPSRSDPAAPSTTAPPVPPSTEAAPGPGPRHCPSCSAGLAAEAVLCVQCGYDTRLGRVREGPQIDRPPPKPKRAKPKPVKPASRASSATGSYVLGVVLSGAGALLGAILWTVIALVSGYEIGWIAWGLGFAAGVGMLMGYRDGDDTISGLTAAGMALVGILAAKVFIFLYVLAPMLQMLDSEEFTRPFLAALLAGQALEESGVSDDAVDYEQQWNAAYANAEGQVSAMNDEEVARRLDEFSESSEPIEEEQTGFATFGMTLFLSAMFGWMDIVFILLAFFTAYKVGTGNLGDD